MGDEKTKGREHHCFCMCWMQKMDKICVVVEGQCFLVYPGDEEVTKASSWVRYNVGMLIENDDVDGERYFYPKSIAQYQDSNFVIGVNGTNVSSIFQIL